jgi:hypothetical protein
LRRLESGETVNRRFWGHSIRAGPVRPARRPHQRQQQEERPKMAKLFSAEWMTQFKDAWNSDPEIKDKLAEIGFKSTIAWGFKDEDDPRGLLVV